MFYPSGRADRLGRLGGDDAEPPLHPRQRRFYIQHPLQIGVLVKHGPHGI
jgi:hypothetical protein